MVCGYWMYCRQKWLLRAAEVYLKYFKKELTKSEVPR